MVLTLVIPAEVATTLDVVHYHEVSHAVLNGAANSVRVWEYPLGSLLAAITVDLIPGDLDRDYLVAFIAFATACDFLVMSGLLRCSTNTVPNVRGAWLWLSASFALGPVTVTRLDIVACAATALGLAALASHRDVLSSWVLWIGASLKVWPALLGISLLITSGRRAWHGASLIATAATFGLLSVLFGWQRLVFDFLVYQQDRGVQTESLWAMPMLWARVLGADYRTSYEFGSMQINGPGAAGLAVAAGVAFPLSLFAALVFCSRKLREWPMLDRVTTSGVVLVGVALLSNKVLSSQYMLWLIVVVAAAMGHSRIEWRSPAAALLAAAVLTHVIFPWNFSSLVRGDVYPVALATVRVALLGLTTLLIVCQIARVSETTNVESPQLLAGPGTGP